MIPLRFHFVVLASLALASFVAVHTSEAAGDASSTSAGSGVSKPMAALAEPPPLGARVLEMMKTNSLGVIEARIYFVEKWELTSVEKAQVFLSMLAKAETDDQRKLAHAAVPFVANTNYGLIRKHLLDPKLPRVVLSVFMTDTLKRQYSVKLPALLLLAQIELHPMRTEAQELLRGYLGRDHGTNWPKWEETMLAWLQSNPR
jgi:hypothetical protein